MQACVIYLYLIHLCLFWRMPKASEMVQDKKELSGEIGDRQSIVNKQNEKQIEENARVFLEQSTI